MRAVIQRVAEASVSVGNEIVGQIGKGLLVFVGIMDGDDARDRQWLASKIPLIRCFPDDDGRMNRSVREIAGGILVISQFTLFGDLRKGTRPSFNRAAAPDFARQQYQLFLQEISAAHVHPAQAGVFAADMHIAAIHDGPVTLQLDTRVKAANA